MSELPEVLETLVVRPGDTLLVRIPVNTSMDSAHQLYERLKARLPAEIDFAIIAAEQLGVYRPKPEIKSAEYIPLGKRKP